MAVAPPAFCSGCGLALLEHARFCRGCGQPIAWTASLDVPPPPSGTIVLGSIPPPPPPEAPLGTGPAKKRKGRPALALGVGAVLFFVASLAFASMRDATAMGIAYVFFGAAAASFLCLLLLLLVRAGRALFVRGK